MAFCVKCGAPIEDGEPVCKNCGAPTNNPTAASYAYQQPVDLSDHTAEMNHEEIERGRGLSVLCYLNILFVILALVAEPNNKYVRYHANQAVVLSVTQMLAALCAIVPFLGWLVGGVVSITLFVFLIMGMVRAGGRRAKDLPIIGKYRLIKQ